MSGIQEIKANYGQEVMTVIHLLIHKKMKCGCVQSHGRDFEILKFLGYPHEGGYVDSKGRKWWLFITCPFCEYDWALCKVAKKLTALGAIK
jgi:hypothetical protein